MMNTNDLREAARLIKQGMAMLDKGPLDFYLRELSGAYDFLLTLAPLQPGTRVMLKDPPIISNDENWGWIGAKHFLVAGAKGTVRQVEADRDGFSYHVEFDDDSWIDSVTKKVNKRRPEERHTYHFSPERLIPIATEGSKP